MSSLATASTDDAAATHTLPQDPEHAVEVLKKSGNGFFVQGKYKKAEGLYTQAIDLGSDDPKLYGNRSAARHQLERYEEALADAVRALEIDPTWTKGYHRKAMALTSLDQLEGAVQAYTSACTLEPDNGGFAKKLVRAQKRVEEAAKRAKIRGLKHWLTIFGTQSDVRLRLGVLAYFWNAATKPERLIIFYRFLTIIGGIGKGGEEEEEQRQLEILKQQFDSEKMTDLPLDNYSDLEIPEQWVEYFTALKSEDKGIYFEQMYLSLNETEKTLVVNDLKFFYAYDGGKKELGGEKKEHV